MKRDIIGIVSVDTSFWTNEFSGFLNLQKSESKKKKTKVIVPVKEEQRLEA